MRAPGVPSRLSQKALLPAQAVPTPCLMQFPQQPQFAVPTPWAPAALPAETASGRERARLGLEPPADHLPRGSTPRPLFPRTLDLTKGMASWLPSTLLGGELACGSRSIPIYCRGTQEPVAGLWFSRRHPVRKAATTPAIRATGTPVPGVEHRLGRDSDGQAMRSVWSSPPASRVTSPAHSGLIACLPFGN